MLCNVLTGERQRTGNTVESGHQIDSSRKGVPPDPQGMGSERHRPGKSERRLLCGHQGDRVRLCGGRGCVEAGGPWGPTCKSSVKSLVRVCGISKGL